MGDLLDNVACPVCGGRVYQDSACPCYGKPKELGGDGVFCCSPPCGNAQEFFCVGTEMGDSCGWWYKEPINPYSSSFKKLGVRPDWVEEYLW